MSAPPIGDSPALHIAKIAMLGGACSGLGAIACVKIPIVQKSIDYLHNSLNGTTALCSNTPYVKPLFKDNPLLHNKLVTEFFCINAVETVLIGGSMVGFGALMKATGIKPKNIHKKGIDVSSGLHP